MNWPGSMVRPRRAFLIHNGSLRAWPTARRMRHLVSRSRRHRCADRFLWSSYRRFRLDGGVMARALVIGGTLFIGRALVEQLLTRGDEVVIMHRGSGTPFGSRVGEIQCDRNEVTAVQAALANSTYHVVSASVYDWPGGQT